MTTIRDAGTATTREVADHWGVCADTARRLLREAGAEPVGQGGRRWRWRDVWRAEGSPHVPAIDWPERKRPLMSAKRCAAADPRGRSERTWRRILARGPVPVVRLSPTIRRVRTFDFEVWSDAC